ncbi:MAG TPA: sugar transferase [Bacteroidales bacterium]|nr:sugar transferase [Bacteroidales bacterium]HPO66693.1 sugar transferase [Bacteroidales bacterium]
MIRFFDFVFSLIGLIILLPVFVVVGILIKCNSKGPIFFMQKRVGKDNRDFSLIKFRTMYQDADKKGLLTVGEKDPRITPVGYFLRKYKIDELPQLINVLKGDMSLVGPRPEVRKYVDLYNEEQRQILNFRPGITDIASIKYMNENEILRHADNPEEYYIRYIMPDKIRLNLEYLHKPTLKKYFSIIFRTIFSIK